jgi:dolichol-phosphate mannosyltransferase
MIVHKPMPAPLGTAQTYLQNTLAVVIPTWRERESLPALLHELRFTLSSVGIPFEILVVDDDSRDGTAELVASMAAEDPRVRLLVRRNERGLAGAILYGWQSTGAGLLAAMDADLQHPPELIRDLLEAIARGHDLALASRYTRGGRIQGWNPLRRLVSAAAIGLTWPLQRPPIRVKDPMSGYFVVRRRCVGNLAFRPTGFKILLEILVRGEVSSVKEVPFLFGKRSKGRSKASLRVAWEYLQLLASLYRLRMRKMPVPEGSPVD